MQRVSNCVKHMMQNKNLSKKRTFSFEFCISYNLPFGLRKDEVLCNFIPNIVDLNDVVIS